MADSLQMGSYFLPTCQSCGAAITANKSFCSNCGAPNSDQTVTAQSDHSPNEQALGSKAQIMLKAGSTALAKSMATAAVVLGPGLAMLMFGLTITGIIWLFCGSFGLMAWTYRKPWRLGLISCLIPPLAAALCYGLQLWLFDKTSPPAALLGGAVLIGLVVGYWRARTHKVVTAPDGGVVAERTIGYLLVWVAAYAVTQGLGLLAMGNYAIRAGLVTGAFSTAMLVVVSVVIWRQKLRMPRPIAMSVALLGAICFGSMTSFVSPAFAQAESEEAAGALQILQDMKAKGDKIYAQMEKEGETDGTEMVTEIESITGDKNKAVLKFTTEGNALSNDKVASRTKERVTVTVTLFDTEASAEVKAKAGEEKYDAEDDTVFSKVAFTNMASDEKSASARSSKGRYRIEVFAQEVWHKQFSQNDESWFNIGFTAVINLSLFLQNIDLDLEPKETEPVGGSDDNDGGNDDENEGSGVSPEQAGEFAAAIAAILITAGIAANIAQAIAAALANALQSGVQMTAEEIEAAIAEGLANAGEAQFDPIYHWNGEAYSINDNGEYWAPDENGTYQWMSKEDALKASARERENAQAYADYEKEQARAEAEAEAEEKRRREKYERERQARFEKGAAQDMENSRNKMREQDDQQRGKEAKEKAEAEVANRRHDQLYNGILNALMGMPHNARVSALINELGSAYESGDTARMNSLWGKVRGVRQSMLDASAQKAGEHELYGGRVGMAGDGLAIVRDTAKTTIAGGLGVATGGTVTALQGALIAGVGTSGLVTIGAAEGGFKAKGGAVSFDKVGAQQGAARGGKDSFNALVGGVDTNGGKLRGLVKVIVPSATDAVQKVSDVNNKTGDWNKAKEDGLALFASKVGQASTGEVFGEQDRQSQLRAENSAKGVSGYRDWLNINNQRAQEAASIAAKKTAAETALDFGHNVVVDGKTVGESIQKTAVSQASKTVAGGLKDKSTED